MAIHDLYPHQKKENSDNFTYDNLPKPLRTQISNLVHYGFGKDRDPYFPNFVDRMYQDIHEDTSHHFGVDDLFSEHYDDYENIIKFIRNEKDVENVLAVI